MRKEDDNGNGNGKLILFPSGLKKGPLGGPTLREKTGTLKALAREIWGSIVQISQSKIYGEVQDGEIKNWQQECYKRLQALFIPFGEKSTATQQALTEVLQDTHELREMFQSKIENLCLGTQDDIYQLLVDNFLFVVTKHFREEQSTYIDITDRCYDFNVNWSSDLGTERAPQSIEEWDHDILWTSFHPEADDLRQGIIIFFEGEIGSKSLQDSLLQEYKIYIQSLQEYDHAIKKDILAVNFMALLKNIASLQISKKEYLVTEKVALLLSTTNALYILIKKLDVLLVKAYFSQRKNIPEERKESRYQHYEKLYQFLCRTDVAQILENLVSCPLNCPSATITTDI